MGYSSAAVTTRSLLFASLRASRAPESDPAGGSRSVQAAGSSWSAQSADVGEIEGKRTGRVGATRIGEQQAQAPGQGACNHCSHQARSAIAPTPASGPGGLLPTSLPDDQAAPLHEYGSVAVDDHGTEGSAVLADPDPAIYHRVRWW